ncbi:ester cyclase [Streptomyces sp. NPDC002573]|uniref:ester cyclase n=1 Tax=Streptomyces sp. NPDC002573 TaxID=3364651 RepID=UPI0036AB946D
MIAKKTPEAASALVPASRRRRKVVGAVTGLAVAAALTAMAVPAVAQSQAKPATAAAASSHSHYPSPLQAAWAYYNSYNGDLTAGFNTFISKNLLLHGFNGPETRASWIAGDLNIKAGLTGFKMTVLDQIVEGDKVVTRWEMEGTADKTIFGIPPSHHFIQLTGISIDRVINGQSVEHWSEGNFGAFLDALRGQSQVTATASK